MRARREAARAGQAPKQDAPLAETAAAAETEAARAIAAARRSAAGAPDPAAAAPHEYFKRAAPVLARLGYEVLPADGKRVLIEGWTHIPLPIAQIDEWAAGDKARHNVSIRTGKVIAIDIDVLSPVVADAIGKSAIEHFGAAPCRVGKAPKRALIYTAYDTNSAFPKLTSPRWKSPGGSEHRVEILATGQQFVAYGRHPDTGHEYEWIGESLAKFEVWELSAVSPEAVASWMRDVVPTLIPSDWAVTQAAGHAATHRRNGAVRAGGALAAAHARRQRVGQYAPAREHKAALEHTLQPHRQREYV